MGQISDLRENRPSLHIFRSHRATDVGSNRTQVPMRKDGILPAFACLKIVIFETVKMLASSFAVKARPILSIRSGSDIGSAELFWELHDCIYLLCGFIAATAAYCLRTVVRARVIQAAASPGRRSRVHVTNSLLTTQLQIYVCCAMWCELFG